MSREYSAAHQKMLRGIVRINEARLEMTRVLVMSNPPAGLVDLVNATQRDLARLGPALVELSSEMGQLRLPEHEIALVRSSTAPTHRKSIGAASLAAEMVSPQKTLSPDAIRQAKLDIEAGRVLEHAVQERAGPASPKRHPAVCTTGMY